MEERDEACAAFLAQLAAVDRLERIQRELTELDGVGPVDEQIALDIAAAYRIRGGLVMRRDFLAEIKAAFGYVGDRWITNADFAAFARAQLGLPINTLTARPSPPPRQRRSRPSKFDRDLAVALASNASPPAESHAA